MKIGKEITKRKKGENKKCAVCPSLFWVKPSRADTRRTCSRECAATYTKQSGRLKGSGNPMFGKVTRVCVWKEVPCGNCGKVVSVREKYLLDKKSTYCSKKCLLVVVGGRPKFGADNPNFKGGSLEECSICKKEFWVTPSQSKTKKFCTNDCHGKWMSIYQTKEGNPRWNPNRMQVTEDNKDRRDLAYNDWKKAVKVRDGWKCRIADRSCNGRLESHHILDWKNYPELRYDINNGITLCHAHHPRGRVAEAKMSPYFKSLITNNTN